MNQERIPVIVGVGQLNDRPSNPDEGLDSLGLMESALRLADADAGGIWLNRLDSLAVVDQISFRALNPVAPTLAARVGAQPRLIYQTPLASGNSPVLLLNQAANRIAAGEIEVAAVAGGEALRTAAARARTASGAAAAQKPTEIKPRSYRERYGLSKAIDVYPLYENATRASYGQTLAEAQFESAVIWSQFSHIAAQNSGAWIKAPKSVDQLLQAGPQNRPIAFPYNKLLVANNSVNQGAAFIVTSLALALKAGLTEDRLVYIGRGAAAHEAEDILHRDRYDQTAAMEVSLRRSLELNKLKAADLDYVELYSCFPCIPKMARRVIDWPLERPATVFGGLTFGGGPIGNYMSHAVVSMVHNLRVSGRLGLLFANGGNATHNHALIISRELPVDADQPHDFDFQLEADSNRGPIPPIDESYEGSGKIETYTVLYERDGTPRHGAIVARSPTGSRFLAKVRASDVETIGFLSDGLKEPVGTVGRASREPGGEVIWTVS